MPRKLTIFYLICLLLSACTPDPEENHNGNQNPDPSTVTFEYPDKPRSPTLKKRLKKSRTFATDAALGLFTKTAFTPLKNLRIAEPGFLANPDANGIIIPASLLSNGTWEKGVLPCLFPDTLMEHFAQRMDSVPEDTIDPLGDIRYLFVFSAITQTAPTGEAGNIEPGEVSADIFCYDMYQDEYLGSVFLYKAGSGTQYIDANTGLSYDEIRTATLPQAEADFCLKVKSAVVGKIIVSEGAE